MSRLHPIPYGAGVLLVQFPDECPPPNPTHDARIVRPGRRRKGIRRG
jgi:hypothetical protein